MVADKPEINYRALVRGGAALLDTHRPGWIWRINLHTLDVNSPHKCPCGQTGGWHQNIFRIDGKMVGFAHPMIEEECREYDYVSKNGCEHYVQLNAAWKELISERRAEAILGTRSLMPVGA